MTSNVRAVIERVLLHEGGVADVGDGMGVTRYGQTGDWLATWGLPIPQTRDDAAENYAVWLGKIRLDEVCDFDPTLGGALVDWSVHSGHVVAIKGLQKALGAVADGRLGPDTMHAIYSLGTDGKRRATLGVHCARLEFIGRIITDKPDKHARYAAGWLNRMATNIRQDCA